MKKNFQNFCGAYITAEYKKTHFTSFFSHFVYFHTLKRQRTPFFELFEKFKKLFLCIIWIIVHKLSDNSNNYILCIFAQNLKNVHFFKLVKFTIIIPLSDKKVIHRSNYIVFNPSYLLYQNLWITSTQIFLHFITTDYHIILLD